MTSNDSYQIDLTITFQIHYIIQETYMASYWIVTGESIFRIGKVWTFLSFSYSERRPDRIFICKYESNELKWFLTRKVREVRKCISRKEHQSQRRQTQEKGLMCSSISSNGQFILDFASWLDCLSKMFGINSMLRKHSWDNLFNP